MDLKIIKYVVVFIKEEKKIIIKLIKKIIFIKFITLVIYSRCQSEM